MTVTAPLLPAADALMPYLEDILSSGYVTNNGKYVQQLEAQLAQRMNVARALAITSGTVALQMALDALVPSGEVITTPFTFPATHHVLLANPRWQMVVSDIDDSFTLCPHKVEAAITSQTTAILAVHPYGFPCDVDGLAEVAEAYGLRLIYDAAPAFGVSVDGRDIGGFGDAAVFSLHATKVFGTLEGGCIVTASPADDRRLRLHNAFGMHGEDAIECTGLNGKMDELRAAVGLATLPRLNGAIAARMRVASQYLEAFATPAFSGIRVAYDQLDFSRVDYNYAYFPISVPRVGGLDRDRVYAGLRDEDILVKKYYHPALSRCPIYDGRYRSSGTPRADQAADEMLCLPIHQAMTDADVERVIAALGRQLARSRSRASGVRPRALPDVSEATSSRAGAHKPGP